MAVKSMVPLGDTSLKATLASVDADRTPMPNGGMKGISAICAQASGMLKAAAMGMSSAGLGNVVSGSPPMFPVARPIASANGAALALGAGALALSLANKGGGKSGNSAPPKSSTAAPSPESTSTPKPVDGSSKSPTPSPGGASAIPEPPKKAPTDDSEIVPIPVPGIPEKKDGTAKPAVTPPPPPPPPPVGEIVDIPVPGVPPPPVTGGTTSKMGPQP